MRWDQNGIIEGYAQYLYSHVAATNKLNENYIVQHKTNH